MSERVDGLITRLSKGGRKTAEAFGNLSDEQCQMVLYREPLVWTARDVLAHLISAEEGLMHIARDIAGGGPGAPEGFDYHAYNASEQVRLKEIPLEQLRANLSATREASIEWMSSLDEVVLDRRGYHPALGEVTLEELINAFHGHHLMHMRDLRALLRSV